MRKTLVAASLASMVLLAWACGGDARRQSHSAPFNRTSFLVRNVVDAASTSDRGSWKRSQIISSRLRRILPPFAISHGNPECVKDSRTFVEDLDRLRLWALKMHDSSGKLPSGLLDGNVNQFGDFDECLSVDEPEAGVRGKYCLAHLQLRPAAQNIPGDVLRAFRLVQSHFAFRSELTDPGHRVPRFSTVNWGLCVPSTCGARDVESHLRSVAERFANGTGFEVEVKVDAAMCQQRKPFRVSGSFFAVSCLFLLVAATAAAATAAEAFAPRRSPGFWRSVLDCFSLRRNGKTLLSLSRPPDDIESVHGIRAINALMLVFCHKSMALFFLPYSNRTSMVEKLSSPWTVVARTASLYTDSFVMISGLLTSYSLVKKLDESSGLDLKNEYVGRLMRIVPPLAAVVLLSTFVLPELGSGPQWNLTVSHHADKCRATWWKNFLFIHNYLGFENMCLTHTHHLGIDTQLFFLCPLLVVLVFKWPVRGTSALLGLAAASAWARYRATRDKNLSFFIYPGISVGQMFDTANNSYIIPFHRLTVYAMGILLGYGLRHCSRDRKIEAGVLRIGWTLACAFLSYAFAKAGRMNRLDYIYDNGEAAVYAALAPVAWSLFLAWLIFASHVGCGGFLGKLMSSKYFLIWTRLSYAVYLTQFPVFFFNVGLQRHPRQYSFFLLVDVLEYGCVLAASVALTLLFDLPFANMKKLIAKKQKSVA